MTRLNLLAPTASGAGGRESTISQIGNTDFSVAVRHTQLHAQQPQVLLCKIKYAVITVTTIPLYYQVTRDP